MATTDTTAGPVAPPPIPPLPPRHKRRRWPFILLFLIIIILVVPGAVLLCLSLQSGGIALRGPASSPAEIACPSDAPPFIDCYVATRVALEPIAAEKNAVLRICCDFIADRQPSTTLTLAMSGDPGTAMTWVGGDGPAIQIAVDGSAISQANTPIKRLVDRQAFRVKISMNDASMDGARRITFPLLDKVLRPEQIDAVLAKAHDLLARLPDGWAAYLTAYMDGKTSPSEMFVAVGTTASGGTVIAEVDGRPMMRIAVTAKIGRSLLFSDALEASNGLSGLGRRLTPETLPSAGDLNGKLAALATSPNHRGLPSDRLQRLANLIDQLDGVTVSKLSRLADEAVRFEAVGQQCIALYAAARAVLTRLDDAVLTYAVALPTGLLSRPPETDDHGCQAPGSEATLAALNQDWRALDLALPLIQTVLEDSEATPPPTPAPAGEDTPAQATAVALETMSRPRRFLLSVASVAKSGASRETFESSLSQTLAVRIGDAHRFPARSRSDVIRMLHRQWSHAGCWLYDTGPGAGSVTLHIEAQFPYLNHVAFHHTGDGQITAVEVTGVSYRQLLQTKRINRGARCQAFLNPARMSDYQQWLAVDGASARTPVDHALRLLGDGPR